MFRNTGITLIEIIIVIAIIALLAAIIGLPFSRFRQTQALENSTNAVVALLNEARTKTLAAVGDTAYGVHVASDQAILFSGATYDAAAPDNQAIAFESPVSLSAISLAGSGADIVFDRLKGTTSDYGTITLTLPNNQTHSISISATGSVKRN